MVRWCCSALQESCDDEDRDAIEQNLTTIFDQRLHKDLAPEVRKAESKLERLTARRSADKSELSWLPDALRGVRALNQPHHKPSVLRLLQAFLLLYGIDEYETRVSNVLPLTLIGIYS